MIAVQEARTLSSGSRSLRMRGNKNTSNPKLEMALVPRWQELCGNPCLAAVWTVLHCLHTRGELPVHSVTSHSERRDQTAWRTLKIFSRKRNLHLPAAQTFIVDAFAFTFDPLPIILLSLIFFIPPVSFDTPPYKPPCTSLPNIAPSIRLWSPAGTSTVAHWLWIFQNPLTSTTSKHDLLHLPSRQS